MSYQEIDDFFEGGEGGAPSFKFNGVGTGVKGVIVDQVKRQQRAFAGPGQVGDPLWFDEAKTEPRTQIDVTLQTTLRDWQGVTNVPTGEDGKPKPGSEDDGLRRVYIKGDARRAVRDALRAAGIAKGGPRNGGTLGLKISGFKPTTKGNPQNLFDAFYAAPPEDFFDENPPGGSTAAQPAPAGPVDPWADAGGASTDRHPGNVPPVDEPPF